MTTIISLAEAAQRLGEDIRICLEPEERLQQKMDQGRQDELWVFNPSTGVSGRGDRRFFDVVYVDRGGWGQLAVREEPSVPVEQSVGQVVVEMNQKGQVRVRRSQGLNGDLLELRPSSLSKGEVVDQVGLPFETNPQRIVGMIDAVLVRSEFPEEEAMWVEDFTAESTDGRSLAALAKLGDVVL